MSDPASSIAGWAIGKYIPPFVAKLISMFVCSAGGAAIIAAFHAETRRETWWRALGGGFGGVVVGYFACRVLAHYVPWLFTGNTLDDLAVVLPIAFVLGALFWGIAGFLQNLSDRLADRRTVDKIADRVGL